MTSIYYVNWEDKEVYNDSIDNDSFWDDMLAKFERERTVDELLELYLSECFGIDYSSFCEIDPENIESWRADILDTEKWYDFRDSAIDEFISTTYDQYIFTNNQKLYVDFTHGFIGTLDNAVETFTDLYKNEYTYGQFLADCADDLEEDEQPTYDDYECCIRNMVTSHIDDWLEEI